MENSGSPVRACVCTRPQPVLETLSYVLNTTTISTLSSTASRGQANSTAPSPCVSVRWLSGSVGDRGQSDLFHLLSTNLICGQTSPHPSIHSQTDRPRPPIDRQTGRLGESREGTRRKERYSIPRGPKGLVRSVAPNFTYCLPAAAVVVAAAGA